MSCFTASGMSAFCTNITTAKVTGCGITAGRTTAYGSCPTLDPWADQGDDGLPPNSTTTTVTNSTTTTASSCPTLDPDAFQGDDGLPPNSTTFPNSTTSAGSCPSLDPDAEQGDDGVRTNSTTTSNSTITSGHPITSVPATIPVPTLTCDVDNGGSCTCNFDERQTIVEASESGPCRSKLKPCAPASKGGKCICSDEYVGTYTLSQESGGKCPTGAPVPAQWRTETGLPTPTSVGISKTTSPSKIKSPSKTKSPSKAKSPPSAMTIPQPTLSCGPDKGGSCTCVFDEQQTILDAAQGGPCRSTLKACKTDKGQCTCSDDYAGTYTLPRDGGKCPTVAPLAKNWLTLTDLPTASE